jgi:hypothetical protein
LYREVTLRRLLAGGFVYSSKIKEEEAIGVSASETSVNFDYITQCKLPEDDTHHFHHSEDFKSKEGIFLYTPCWKSSGSHKRTVRL